MGVLFFPRRRKRGKRVEVPLLPDRIEGVAVPWVDGSRSSLTLMENREKIMDLATKLKLHEPKPAIATIC